MVVQAPTDEGRSEQRADAHDESEASDVQFAGTYGEVEIGGDGGVEGAAEGGDVEEEGGGAGWGVIQEEMEGLALGVEDGMEFGGAIVRVAMMVGHGGVGAKGFVRLSHLVLHRVDVTSFEGTTFGVWPGGQLDVCSVSSWSGCHLFLAALFACGGQSPYSLGDV